jgi:chromatin assembly factor 1 subunit A
MANFFGKPKASTSTVTSPSKGYTASSSALLSDFDRVFKPFVLKKDAELAPVNWFRDALKRKRQANEDVIVIDEDDTDDIEVRDVQMHEPDFDPEASPRCESSCCGGSKFTEGLALAHLRRVLSACPSSPTRTCSSSTVRSIMVRLSEAEVSDDTAVVRALLSELHDRTRILAKVLIFHSDERPGYYGTFTKRSRLIKPRRPFARDDIAIDYAYDSGAEWGEEEEGGGDDILGDSDDERDDEEESDDLDGWLVDGDDGETATPVDEREGLEAFPFPPLPEGGKHKRKVEKEKEKEKETDTESKTKKRKAVVPLVPFIKGPCWEAEIGDCEYEPLNHYRIQFFNGEFSCDEYFSSAKRQATDTPYPLDPFSFVSVPADIRNSSAAASGSKLQPHSLYQRYRLTSSTQIRQYLIRRRQIPLVVNNHQPSAHERYPKIPSPMPISPSSKKKSPAWARRA